MLQRPRVLIQLTLIVAAFAATLLIQGCSAWTAEKGPPAMVVAADSTRQYRVTVRDCPPVVLRRCRVANDTLTGYSEARPDSIPATWVQQEWAYRADIPVGIISRLESSEVSAGATAKFLWVIGGVLLMWATITMPLGG